jgi:hypothetical protein
MKKTVLLGFLFALQSYAYVRKPRAPKQADKSLLYETYPQLIANTTSPCVQGLSQLLINMYTDPRYEMMVQSSMHGLDDLGSQWLCQNGPGMSDLATYSTLQLNITH